jgi:hypothetical protein
MALFPLGIGFWLFLIYFVFWFVLWQLPGQLEIVVG